MKISGFTFLRNGVMLGYPFEQSIRSILPLVDEFVVALGPCEDDTEARLLAIDDPKIRIIHTAWNMNIRNDRKVKGFVYGQQKSIAWFNCTGDWAFYLEGDEVLHEDDLPVIRAAMEKHLNDDEVESLVFDYLHFYGNQNTIAWSPAWYRMAPRVMRNNIPAWAPKGLFFTVLEDQKTARYPKAAHSGARIFHYGWVRKEEELQRNKDQVERFWSNKQLKVEVGNIDPQSLRAFEGSHPSAIQAWLPAEEGLFKPNADHKLTKREKRHRILMKLEKMFGFTVNKNHFSKVRWK